MLAGARVLIADDDLGLLEAVALALEDLGATVVRARSGAELMDRIAEAGPFSLIITDVAMPWMTGLQALHSARCAGLDTPVLVMTALKSDAVNVQVKTLGRRAALLRKPFVIGQLEAMAEKLLATEPSSEESRAPS